MDPIKLLSLWGTEEQEAGVPNTKFAVLATVAKDSNIPHSRVVAIREADENGLLFFTQKGTKKVTEILSNPNASMTFWFEIKTREVIIDGIIEALTDEENEKYWQSYPKEPQVRFYSYAPTSGEAIENKELLEEKREKVREQFKESDIPVHPLYCGFRLKPSKFIFYTYNSDKLSDVVEYTKDNEQWKSSLLSP